MSFVFVNPSKNYLTSKKIAFRLSANDILLCLGKEPLEGLLSHLKRFLSIIVSQFLKDYFVTILQRYHDDQ